ncbi:MAG: DedA family protein [Blastocatellia bacterium]
MEFIKHLIDIVLHLDKHLDLLIGTYQGWAYGILFLIIFCETGLVVTPFLPGDSLLFALGALSAAGSLNAGLLCVILMCAAIIGDNLNYWIGRTIGAKLFTREDSKLFNKQYLTRTEKFYEKYGAKTVVIARFVPIVRTFAPFVAGFGRMKYPKFLAFSVAGGILWICGLVSLGYFFGNLPIVKNNFGLVIIAIIFISVLPAVIEALRARKATAH